MDFLFWKNKHVLITGGTGFVGSHLVEALAAAGANIVVPVYDLQPLSYFITEKLDKQVIIVPADVKDFWKMKEILTTYEIEIVFHLAAQALVTVALKDPYTTLQTNVLGTYNILEACRQLDTVQAIIVASSDKAYGKSTVLPYTEDMPLYGDAPYEVSKSCTDLITQMYAKTYHLPVTITRFGNIFGPGDINWSRIIPGSCKALVKKELLEIRSDGTMIREYIFVKDVVAAYCLLAESIEKTQGKAYNLTSHEKLSVLDVVHRIAVVAKQEIKHTILNVAKAEIQEQCLSAKRIEQELGWKTTVTFDEGILQTLSWYKKVLEKN